MGGCTRGQRWAGPVPSHPPTSGRRPLPRDPGGDLAQRSCRVAEGPVDADQRRAARRRLDPGGAGLPAPHRAPRPPHQAGHRLLGRGAATPATALPMRLLPSKQPSPVRTRSAAATRSSSRTRRRTSSIPGSRRAPTASSAAPSPPAAPAPGRSRTATPRCASSTSAQRVSACSSTETSCGDAPFCGPKTALAPPGPAAARRRRWRRRDRPRAGPRRRAAPPPASAARRPRAAAPPPRRAATAPAPPAPRRRRRWSPTRRARRRPGSPPRPAPPGPAARRRTSWSGAGPARPAASRCRPAAWALSTYAVVPSTSSCAVTVRASASSTGTSTRLLPGRAADSTSTQARSAVGQRAAGRSASRGRGVGPARASARAASAADRVPPKESGASSTRTARSCRTGTDPPAGGCRLCDAIPRAPSTRPTWSLP